MDALTFWAETRRRRNQFFLTWVGWLVVGLPLWGIWHLIFRMLGVNDLQVSGTAALFTWGVFWFWVGHRLRQLRCYRCGEQAFSHPYFFMKDARFKNCGAKYGDA
jgi:hypothetical protein